ncbi:MAG: tRNA epoxyqueuosine(34) reductase QueG [Flavobacteriaceae bacterium]|nr:tRNA epoxyqueuosine(34) reductase QueG [Flavobacteriaceae bacterium]
MMHRERLTKFIKSTADGLGFISCGVSKAEFLEEEAPRLEQWLSQNYHGKMDYMQQHFDKRLDPTKLVEGSKSVISLLYNYYPSEQQTENTYKISKYAYGVDYHFVIKDKLKTLLATIEEELGQTLNARVFVDSAPVLEKAWAAKSGLGWIGKNANLLSKQKGSFFFIAEIISELELVYDNPTIDHCGSCTACIEACPTAAIVEPYVVDGSKCISYFTIELKDAFNQNFNEHLDDWMFGCDVCQDVCPWNRFSKPHNEPAFMPKEELLKYTKAEWQELTKEVFQEIFKKSAVKRTKYSGLMRNITYLKEKNFSRD